MAKDWKQFIVRLDPRVHYALTTLSPKPTLAVRHLINLYVKKLINENTSGINIPTELDINFKELEENDRES